MTAATLRATSVAFRTLYERRHAFVWGVLRRLGVPEPDVEDLLQDVFVIVHRRLHEFEGRSATTTWLYAITVRVYWNYARRQRSRPRIAPEAPILDESVGPERFAAHREAADLLEQLLGGLDPDKRTAYVLAELEGLSAPEIAAVTGTKTRTVYSRIRAAKQLVEASARRVIAREHNDTNVRRLARTTTRPPAGARRRAWAALLLRLPGLGTTASAWLSTAALPLLLGLTSAGAVTLWQRPADAPVPTPTATPTAPAPSVQAAAAPPSPPPPTVQPPAPTTIATPRPMRASRGRTPRTPEPEHEVALLQRARLALKQGRPASALVLLREHRSAHPNSALGHERDRTTLSALCALGRASEAEVLADRLGLPRACSASDHAKREIGSR